MRRKGGLNLFNWGGFVTYSPATINKQTKVKNIGKRSP